MDKEDIYIHTETHIQNGAVLRHKKKSFVTTWMGLEHIMRSK